MAEVIGNWPFNAIVGQLPLIEESLTSGINDPDPTVRAEARRSVGSHFMYIVIDLVRLMLLVSYAMNNVFKDIFTN